jgi:DNA-3-methyladenine glycosylase II
MSQAAIEHLTRADQVLGSLIARVGPCGWKPDRRRSPFESLVQAVVCQHLNGTAAMAIQDRVKALYPYRRFPAQHMRDPPGKNYIWAAQKVDLNC